MISPRFSSKNSDKMNDPFAAYTYNNIEFSLKYLHFSDDCPHLRRYVYHNVSTVVRSGLLQVVEMSNLTLYFDLTNAFIHCTMCPWGRSVYEFRAL